MSPTSTGGVFVRELGDNSEGEKAYIQPSGGILHGNPADICEGMYLPVGIKESSIVA
jgi:hypothetical protein